MRIRNSNELSSRISEVREEKRKIFAMLEGATTEPNYFSTLFNDKRFSNIEYLYFEKDDKEKGWSNPKKLINYLQVFITNEATKLSFGEVKKIIFDVINNESLLDIVAFKTSFNTLQSNYKILDKSLFKKENLNLILNELSNTSFKQLIYNDFDSIINHVKEYIKDFTYDEAIDSIVLIVDRDKKSFSKKQYDYVLEHCIQSNIDFVITNPCFEFYLALHYEYIDDLNRNKMLENVKEENGNYYSLNYLLKKDPFYRKNKYDVLGYVKKYPIVQKNIKLFTTDKKRIKDELGSNICEWIDSLINDY